MTLSVVILAAGNGKRMHSSLPKVLHPIAGIPLLKHVVNTAQALRPHTIHVVYGVGMERVKNELADLAVNWVPQSEPKGTGHALLQALPQIHDDQRILVLYGDVPLIQQNTLEALLSNTSPQHLGILVAKLENPNGFGRIIRDEQENIIDIIEHKDATEEVRQIQEVNTGVLTAQASAFKKWLPLLNNHNAQGEFYLTDVIKLAVKEQVKVSSTLPSSTAEVRGVNNRQELIELERYYQLQKAKELMLQGVTIMDPSRFDCRGSLTVEQDIYIDINVILEGEVVLGQGCSIGQSCSLKNVRLGKNVTIKSHCVIEDAIVEDDCIIGPFARIRPQSYLKKGVHVGNFVELKKTQMAERSKANHLTYLGDAIIGKDVNIGAGTITCNYDGKDKFTTIIEDGAFIGSGTELVAPLTIGTNAYIGAGSTITRDAPKDQLTVGRARQVTIKGWKKPHKDGFD